MKKILRENEQLLNDVINNASDKSSSGFPGTDFLKKKFAELYCKVNEDNECISCTDELTADTIEVPDCAHVICKTCCGKLLSDETKNNRAATCPTCRKPLRQMVKK